MLKEIKSISGIEEMSKKDQQIIKGGIPPQCRDDFDCCPNEYCRNGVCFLEEGSGGH